jgi:hypothetical protein
MCLVKDALKRASWQVSSEDSFENQQLWDIPPENIQSYEGVKQNFQIPPAASNIP